jgi:hypothetical protein
MPPIDPQIKNLVSAIGEAETGASSPKAYTARGKSGEYGRYQFMPDTWKAYASEAGVNSPLESASIEDQNKVAYHKIEQWKKQGYNPAQIASMWNAGPGKPNAYKEGWKGTHTNPDGTKVAYDTPAYAEKVSAAYQRLKGQSGVLPQGQNPIQGQDPGFFQGVGNDLAKAGTGVANAVGDTLSGKINPLSGLIQGAGAIAGGIGGLTDTALSHIPVLGGLYKGVTGAIGQGVQAAANTDAGQGLISNYQKFAQAHPELAGDLGSAFDIATAIPVLKGLGVAKTAAKSGISTALKGSTDAALETIAPKLTAKEAAEALTKRGTVQKGLLRETQLAPDPKMQEIAKSVQQSVPNFNPSKSLLYNISETQKVATKMAKDLKTEVQAMGANRIYPRKELMSRLRSLEKPDLIASDTTLNNVYDRLIKRVESLSQKKGGKVGDLLDLRQEFDALVKRQYPNLYNSETLTPLRQAVRDIRETLTGFTAEQLPEVALRDSLLAQHRLLTAIENMAEKATKGSTKEIGTNAISRFADRHPVIRGLVKTGSKAAIEGTGIGTMLNILGH